MNDGDMEQARPESSADARQNGAIRSLEQAFHMRIDMAEQRLYLAAGENVYMNIPVSTAANGPGQIKDSGCTPLGRHYVRAKIGAGQPRGAVFVGRRPTGEIYHPKLRQQFPKRDWILTRILWLSGCEIGRNRRGDVDTMQRYIYLHGTPDDVELGQPGSAGCIRVDNDDMITLFDNVPVGTPVLIA